jgi:hypothetical protein
VKANELIIRQDRVIYTLMILLASLGLLWSFWQRQHPADTVGTAATTQPTAAKVPATKTIYVR